MFPCVCLDSIIIDVGFFLISFFLVFGFLHKCIKIEKELASNQILFTKRVLLLPSVLQ